MARHANPIELQRLTGADKKDPQRYKRDVPKSEMALGSYPETRSTDPRDCWHEIASCAIPGVLTGADRFMMEIASDLLAEYRAYRQDETGNKTFPNGKYTHMIGLFARFGFSPSDRTKLGVTKHDDDDDFESL